VLTRLRCWLASNVPRKPRTGGAGCADELTFVPENEIDVVLGGANPNPRRVGCPPRPLLIELARRDRSISDPWYDHLSECSPCYREVRALQQAGRRVARDSALSDQPSGSTPAGSV
jgi:hypothetical protein